MYIRVYMYGRDVCHETFKKPSMQDHIVCLTVAECTCLARFGAGNERNMFLFRCHTTYDILHISIDFFICLYVIVNLYTFLWISLSLYIYIYICVCV